MVDAAERISERMDPGDRRIGEGQAGKMRAEQHRRARFEIAGLVAGREQIAGQQPQRLAGQRVGQRVLEPRRGVRLDRVDDGVDAGRGGHVARQAEGQARRRAPPSRRSAAAH